RSGISAVRVRGLPGGERLLAADSLATADQLYRVAAAGPPVTAGGGGAAGGDAAELQRLLLVRWFHPSLAPNERESEAARARARGAVDRVKARVLAGEKIVGARGQGGGRGEGGLGAHQGGAARH